MELSQFRTLKSWIVRIVKKFLILPQMPRRSRRLSVAKKRQLLAALNLFSDLEHINSHFEKFGLRPVSNMQEATDVIGKLCVNLIDFVNGKFKPFPNIYALKHYTVKTRKYCSKRWAKDAGLSPLLKNFKNLTIWSVGHHSCC